MKLQIRCKKAQLLNTTNGKVYVVSPDGTTLFFRDDVATQLRRKYLEQSNADVFEFQIQLNVQIAQPVAHRKVSQGPELTQGWRERFLLACSALRQLKRE